MTDWKSNPPQVGEKIVVVTGGSSRTPFETEVAAVGSKYGHFFRGGRDETFGLRNGQVGSEGRGYTQGSVWRARDWQANRDRLEAILELRTLGMDSVIGRMGLHQYRAETLQRVIAILKTAKERLEEDDDGVR